MAPASILPESTRRVLKLARSDRDAARAQLKALGVDAQVALVCEAPPQERAALIGLVPNAEEVVARMPDAELCFTVKAIGIESAGWLLELATPEQIVTGIDLDAWDAYTPDVATLGLWLAALSQTETPVFVRALSALDAELLTLLLKSKIEVFLKYREEDGWQAPVGGKTIDGQFYYVPLAEGDDLDSIEGLLQTLFVEEYWTYFRLMQSVSSELDSDNQEWAHRWRAGRLQDLGFPSWDEAMSVYRYLAPKERAALADHDRPLDVTEWNLPVWIPQLPGDSENEHRVLRAIAHLDADERRGAFYALIALANKVAVADRMPLADVHSTPRAIEKTAHFASLGLEHVAAKNGLDDVSALRSVSLERLFRVGANLDADRARG